MEIGQTVKILIFTENPSLTAELLFEIEAIGPFCSIVADGDGGGDGLPDADGAVVALGSANAARISELASGDMPLLFLGDPPPNFASRGARTAMLPYPIDYRLLARRLFELVGDGQQADVSPAEG